MWRIYLGYVLAALTIVSVPVVARQGGVEIEQRPVGARVIAATSTSPLELVDALRAEGFVTGLHIRSDKWQSLRIEKRLPRVGGTATATLGQAVAAFRLSHPGWSVETSATGLVIRDVGLEPRGDIVPEFVALNMEIRSAFSAAERAINPSMPVLGGMVGSIISAPDGVSPPRPEPTLVTVHLTQATLEEILNAISAESPGTGWVLVRHESGDREHDLLSVRYRGNLHSDSAWPLQVPTRR